MFYQKGGNQDENFTCDSDDYSRTDLLSAIRTGTHSTVDGLSAPSKL